MILTKIKEFNNVINRPFTVPQFLDKKYYPSLDGWRAIAVIIVIADHLKGNIGTDTIYTKITNTFIFGRLGVDIFFVLSGFLITSLLIKEKINSGKINIVNFFIRRALRIIPVLYLYLVVCFILNNTLELNISFISYLWPALYLSNIVYSNPIFAHTWSLSVEEQYYLFWPFLLKYFKSPLIICIVTIGLLPLINIINYLYPSDLEIIIKHVYIPISTIFTGALVAILSFKKIILINYFNSSLLILVITLLIIIFYLQNNGLLGRVLLPFGTLLTNFFIAYAILSSLIMSNYLFTKFLNQTFLIKIGMMSYSLYIWQQLFIQPNNTYLKWYKISFFPLNVILIVVISYVSYTFFEKYFLSLKHKFFK